VKAYVATLEKIIILSMMVALLGGCAVTRNPVFTPPPSGAFGVENHVELRTVPSSILFKIRSQGKTFGDVTKETKDIQWTDIGHASAHNFRLSLYVESTQSNAIKTFFSMPVDDPAWFPSMSKLAALEKLLFDTEARLRKVFGSKAVGATINVYLAKYRTQMLTPYTDWQDGPLIDPVQLNLAIPLPPMGANFERHKAFNDSFFLTSVMRIFAHEYAHVVNRNKPFRITTTPLGDEFIAHSVDMCTSFGIVGFTNENLLKQMLDLRNQFINDKYSVIQGQPFATSTTGGQLAFISISTMFSNLEVIALNDDEKRDLLMPYCKMIVDKNPSIETTKDGLDWIEKNILSQTPASLRAVALLLPTSN
jgi:hypothetical protein